MLKKAILSLLLFLVIPVLPYPVSYRIIDIGHAKVHLIGDAHGHRNGISPIEEQLLATLDKLNQQTKDPIALIWEMDNPDNPKDSYFVKNERLFKQNKFIFLIHGFRYIEDAHYKYIKLIRADNRTNAQRVFSDILTAAKIMGEKVNLNDILEATKKLLPLEELKISDLNPNIDSLEKNIEKLKHLNNKAYAYLIKQYQIYKNGWESLYKSITKNGNSSFEDFLLTLKTSDDIYSLYSIYFDILNAQADLGFLCHLFLSSDKTIIVHAGLLHTDFIATVLKKYFHGREIPTIQSNATLAQLHNAQLAKDITNDYNKTIQNFEKYAPELPHNVFDRLLKESLSTNSSQFPVIEQLVEKPQQQENENLLQSLLRAMADAPIQTTIGNQTYNDEKLARKLQQEANDEEYARKLQEQLNLEN